MDPTNQLVNDLDRKDFNLEQTLGHDLKDRREEGKIGELKRENESKGERGRERMYLNFYVSKNPCFW